MRRAFFCAVLCLALGGCSGGAYRELREIENFEIVQTLGVDYADGVYTVTAATGTGADGEVSVIKSSALTLARAMRQMQNYSSRKYVFFAHTANYLIGEAAAGHSLGACLEYVERGFDIRLDAKLFVVKGSSAEKAIVGASSEEGSINEHLLALEKDVDILSENHIFTCGEVIEELSEDGGTVVTAISLEENRNAPLGENGKIVQVAGYAVFGAGQLLGYADAEQARGITLLMNNFVSDTEEIADGEGGYAAVELRSGKVSCAACFKEGILSAVEIRAGLQGGISEMESPLEVYNSAVIEALEKKAAEKVLLRLSSAIELGRELKTDVAEIGKKLAMKYPGKFSEVLGEEWAELLGAAEIKIIVEVRLDRTYELGVSLVEKELGKGGK